MKGLMISVFSVLLVASCGGITYTDSAAKASQTPDTQVLKGYVSSAFDITVDGENYKDSEDFYSKEIDTLQTQADAAGYADWALTFDAKIGLDDLRDGMKVFVISSSVKGYAAQVGVDAGGRFNVTFPATENAKYQIRAVKRINVILKNPDTTATNKKVVWCYNFSANAQDVEMGSATGETPIILNTFTTELTKYECSNSQTTGISIPATK